MSESNAINANTAGILGNTGTSFTGTAAVAHNLIIGGATSSTLVNVAPSATSGVPVISQGASADPTFGTAVVAGGGTGVASFANTSALLASGTTTTGNLQNIASVATGSILTSAGTSTLPAWTAAATAGASWVKLSTQTPSNVASIAFNDTAFNVYVLMYYNAVPITNGAHLTAVYTTDSGGTYVATGYASGLTYVQSISGTWSNINSTTFAYIGLSADASSLGQSATIWFYGFNAARSFSLSGSGNAFSGGGGFGWINDSFNGTSGANGIKISYDSGNISSGSFTWYGIRI